MTTIQQGPAGQVVSGGAPSAAGNPIIGWGAGNVSATTTTRYLFPGYDMNLAQTSPIQVRAPVPGTLRNLRLRQNVPAGNGLPIVYTLRVNGVPTALAVSIASTASDASDLVNAVAVAAGDLLDWQITKAAGVGSGPNDVALECEWSP